MAPMNPDFAYDSLDQENKQIRLLELLPQSQNNPNITSKFLPPVALSKPGSYEALSYTWGDTTSLCKIQLNEQDFNVTPNLLAALTALKYADRSRTLWIDAICIDQDDDADKNYQVPLMEKIYTKAAIINVWLGLEEIGALSAFDILEHSTLSKESGLEGPDGGPVARDTWQPNPNNSTLLDALDALCHRPYWTRIWIIQEVTLAKDIHIYSGARQVRWDIFEEHISALSKDAHTRELLANEELSDDESDAAQTIQNICDSQCYTILKNGATGVQNKRLLTSLLQDYWRNFCKNPRDKVYGLLSLASDVSDTDIPIRYGQPLGFVYLDVLQFCHTKAFPDNWTKIAYFSQTLLRAFGPDSHGISQSFGNHPRAMEPGFIANQRANVIAFAALPLHKLGPSLEDYCANEVDDVHKLSLKLGGLTSNISPRYLYRYRRCAQEFFEQAIWKTLHTLDCVRDGEHIIFHRLQTPALNELPIPDDEDDEDEIQLFPSPDYTQLELPSIEPLPANPHPTSWNKYRFFSVQGTLGVITNKALKGDYISWLKGCYSAIVLRPEGDGFLLVGRAVFLRDLDYSDARRRFPRKVPYLECREMPLAVFQEVTM